MVKQKQTSTTLINITPNYTTHKAQTTKKITNWTQYSNSLTQRGNFTVLLNKAVLGSVPEQTGRAGHPTEYTDAIILFLAQLREFMQLPLRQTIGMARFIFAQAGLHTIALPSYATLSRRMGTLRVPLIHNITAVTLEMPIIFLPDSTGLKISGEGEWKVKKHGVDPTRHRQWLKVHLGTDYASRQIIAVRTTHAHDHDNQSLIPLIDTIPPVLKPQLKMVIGDGAYDSESLYREVAERGATLLVPPPKNAIWHGDIVNHQLVDALGWETRNGYVRACLRLGRVAWCQAPSFCNTLSELSVPILSVAA